MTRRIRGQSKSSDNHRDYQHLYTHADFTMASRGKICDSLYPGFKLRDWLGIGKPEYIDRLLTNEPIRELQLWFYLCCDCGGALYPPASRHLLAMDHSYGRRIRRPDLHCR